MKRLVLFCCLSGCAQVAVSSAPAKKSVADVTEATKHAQDAFWSTLHDGRYDDIGAVLDRLQAAYLQQPNDPRTAAHIAFLHIWRISERTRQTSVTATITDDLMLARRYFEEAVRLAPDDARFAGFLAATTMSEGKIHHDEKLKRRGFFAMKDAVAAWPEFNLFTRGYAMSGLPHTDAHYAQALDDQWATLDKCTHSQVDRRHPSYAPFMAKETREGQERACWNSWIAPHNFEGFFLNMGDMLVKNGDPATAKEIYAQARLAKAYPSWPYRGVLERRIADANANVARFQTPGSDPEHQIMANTSFACMGCHQTR